MLPNGELPVYPVIRTEYHQYFTVTKHTSYIACEPELLDDSC